MTSERQSLGKHSGRLFPCQWDGMEHYRHSALENESIYLLLTWLHCLALARGFGPSSLASCQFSWDLIQRHRIGQNKHGCPQTSVAICGNASANGLAHPPSSQTEILQKRSGNWQKIESRTINILWGQMQSGVKTKNETKRKGEMVKRRGRAGP